MHKSPLTLQSLIARPCEIFGLCVFKLFGQGFVQDRAPAMHKVQAIGEKGDSAESSRELP